MSRRWGFEFSSILAVTFVATSVQMYIGHCAIRVVRRSRVASVTASHIVWTVALKLKFYYLEPLFVCSNQQTIFAAIYLVQFFPSLSLLEFFYSHPFVCCAGDKPSQSSQVTVWSFSSCQNECIVKSLATIGINCQSGNCAWWPGSKEINLSVGLSIYEHLI